MLSSTNFDKELVKNLISSTLSNPSGRGCKYVTSSGASRAAIPFMDDYIIKVEAYVQLGQNESEYKIWNKCPEEYRHLLVPIIDSFMINKKRILIVEKVTPVTELWFNSGSRVYRTHSRGYLDFYCEKLNISTREYYSQLVELVKATKIGLGDVLWNRGNMGVNKEGKLVILDYGIETGLSINEDFTTTSSKHIYEIFSNSTSCINYTENSFTFS